MPILRQLDSQGNRVADFQLDGKTELWIGRAPENEIVLASNDVSRRHARVMLTEHGYMMLDNDSQNGLVVEGELVRSHFLKSGDVVKIGTVSLEFVETAALEATVILQTPPRAAMPVPKPVPPPPAPPPRPPVYSPPPPPPPPQAAYPPQPQQQPMVSPPYSPPPQPVPQQPPPAKKGCTFKGCALGCLAMFIVVAGLLFAGYVWWAKPPWAGKLKFWRTSLNPQQELGVAQEEVDFEGIDQRVAADKAARQEADRKYGLNPANYVKKEVSAANGDRLQTPQGATLEIPPGALPRDAVVEFAPKAWPASEQRTDDVKRISDVYSIRVDGQEHTQFQQPLTLEIPALLEMDGRPLSSEELRAYWWNGTAWEPYPSPVEIAGDKIRFQIEHATDIIGGITGFIGQLGSISGTRGELEPWMSSWRFAGHSVYRTQNFALYYVAPGPRADSVPADSVYSMTKGRKSGEHPYYVVDLGAALEDTITHASKVGLTPNTLWLSKRHTVMIEPAGAFGITPLGGPVYLDNRMDGLAAGVDFGEFHKVTAIHEFIHVIQDEYFNIRQTFRPSTTSFIETSAQALSELLRYRSAPKEHPSPYMSTSQYLLTMPDFILTTIDGEGRGEKALSYSWGAFLIWMDVDGGFPGFSANTMKRKAQATQFAGVPNTMAQVVAEMKPGQTLSAAFTRFATEYLHDDMWSNKFFNRAWWTDRGNLGKLSQQQMKDLFFHSPGAAEERSAYHHARKVTAFDHLTARLDVFDATGLANDVPGKAFLRFHNVSKPGAQVLVFPDRFSALNPQQKGSAQQITLTAGTEQTVEIPNFGNHTPVVPAMAANRLNLVLINDKPDEDGLDFEYDAWLLLPPSNVMFDKRSNSVELSPGLRYIGQWNPSPLSKSKTIFKGYNVYRRKLGDKTWPATPLNAQPITEAKYEDTPPDKFDYEYSVTTLDNYAHESEKSLAENDDPFAGEWSGSFVLKSGTLVNEEKMSKEDKEIWKDVIPLLKKLEKLLKLGVPIRFKLERTEGKYYITPISAFGKRLDPGDPGGHFKRVSKHNLQWVDENPTEEDKKKPPPPLYFSLEYPEEIHNTYSHDDLTVEWRFVRAMKMTVP